MKTYRVLAALLDYPNEALLQALGELATVLDEEAALSPQARAGIDRLLDILATGVLIEHQERYVDLFDRVRSLSLNLFEHVHGESRDRGQAMVDLKALYEAHGLALTSCELPDYAPALLEFLSCVDPGEATELLRDMTHIFEAIGARLEKRGSAYSGVFAALLELAGAAPDVQPLAVADEDIRQEDDPETVDALWAEEPAFSPSPACGVGKQASVSVVRFHRGIAA